MTERGSTGSGSTGSGQAGSGRAGSGSTGSGSARGSSASQGASGSTHARPAGAPGGRAPTYPARPDSRPKPHAPHGVDPRRGPDSHRPADPRGRGAPLSKRAAANLAHDQAAAAAEVAERSGVPLWGAYRIVRGELTLNELLQELIRRERFERLQKAGMDSDLAGHVVSGTLDEARAGILMKMRQAGRRRFSDDRIESAGESGARLALWRFGASDLEVGCVVKARTYDFDFKTTGAPGSDEPDGAPVLVYKHDVKLLTTPENAPAVAAARRFEKKVLQEGLGPSREKRDRYRPSEDLLAKVTAAGTVLRWVFRDGTAIEGRAKSFGRWDVDLDVGDASLTLFLHALHSATDRNLKRV